MTLPIFRSISKFRFVTSYWLVIFFATATLFFTLGFGSKKPEYRVEVAPSSEQTGDVRAVFYGQDFSNALKNGQLILPTSPTSDWQIVRGGNTTTLITNSATEPFMVRSTVPLTVGLVRHPLGGKAKISNDGKYIKEIDLRSNDEVVYQLHIGGPESLIPASKDVFVHSVGAQSSAALLVFLLFAGITWRMVRAEQKTIIPPRRFEVIVLALPLLMACGLTLIAFTPANVAYDGSLQWVQAASRGDLYAPLGYPTTYFMRLFTVISNSPLPLIASQSVAAAFGTALILRELRFRGVSFSVTLLAAILFAISPQYAVFFTALGKDALSLAGTLFFAWAMLAIFRQRKASTTSFGMLTLLATSGLFAGLMRFNALPVILPVTFTFLAFLYWRQRSYRIIWIGLIFILVAFGLPRILVDQANNERAPPGFQGTSSSADVNLPLGAFANLYIFHLFNAVIASGVDVPAEQARYFHDLMPKERWHDYTCRMTDGIVATISQNLKLKQNEYDELLVEHQLDMAKIVLRLALENPGVALARQACITELLWKIGLGERPFEATATLGYDNVDSRFLVLAGENRTKFRNLREAFNRYHLWSERSDYFWLFWKPALSFIIGLFITGLYIFITRDIGVAFVLLVAILSVGLLFFVIPFPAYRYAYPAVFLMQLLSVLIFARPLKIK